MDPNLENQNQDAVIDENALIESSEAIDPSLETQDDITKQIVGEQSQQTPGNQNPNNPAPVVAREDDFDLYLENTIKSTTPEFVLPKELKEGKKADGTPLTPAERNALRAQLIIDNTELEFEQDDFVKQYIQAKANGVDAAKFASDYHQRVNVLNMPSKDFIETYYRGVMKAEGQRMYSDDAIAKLVDGKSEIELDQIAGPLKGKVAQQMASKFTQQNQATIDSINAKNAKIVEPYVQKLNTETSIFGIDLPEVEKSALATSVKTLFVKDKTGTSEFDRMMQDDEFVLQLAPVALLIKQGKLPGLVSTMKETIKAKGLDKLDLNPQNNGGGLVPGPEGVDEKALVGDM